MRVSWFALSRRVGCVAVLSALSACAPWQLDKSVSPNPADVLAIQSDLAAVRRFQQAVYDTSIAAVDRCSVKTLREPYALLTIGHLVDFYSDERLVAYWAAGGYDETFKVLWADASSPIQVGDRVIKINGKPIENNKTGLGEQPLERYIKFTLRDRDAAQEQGVPFRVTVSDAAGEREIEMPMQPACRVMAWTMPLIEGSAYSSTPRHFFDAVVIANTAVRMAETPDELRYLAGLAIYFSDSPEAANRQVGHQAVVTLGIAAVIVNPLLYPIVSPLAIAMGRGITSSGMTLDAALFSAQLLHDLGGNPAAGLDLMQRLEAKGLKADYVLLSQDDQAVLRQFIDTTRRPAESLAAAPAR